VVRRCDGSPRDEGIWGVGFNSSQELPALINVSQAGDETVHKGGGSPIEDEGICGVEETEESDTHEHLICYQETQTLSGRLHARHGSAQRERSDTNYQIGIKSEHHQPKRDLPEQKKARIMKTYVGRLIDWSTNHPRNGT
jgi:hypothetical protein